MDSYENVVIGSGRAGKALAAALANAGQSTALVDDGQEVVAGFDGGATPSEALRASANMARLARRAGDFGIDTGTVAVDLTKVQRRKHAVMDGIRTAPWPTQDESTTLTRIEGRVTFTGPHTLEVAEGAGRSRNVQGRRIFINTGARPAPPSLPGLDQVSFLDAEAAMELDDLPSHLMVIGGSDVALELAQMFCRFGARVSIVEKQERLLPREDRDVAATVAQVLREDGIEVFLETEAMAAEIDGRGGIRLHVRNPAGTRSLSGSHLLVVDGRKPNTDGLHLEAAGIELDDRGYIRVNDRLETSVSGVYALGDVNGGPPFEHIAHDDLRIVRANVLENSRATTAGRMCPYTVFIDPQLGRVGLTEAEARRQGLEVRIARLPMSRVPRAVQLGESRGFIKVVVESGSGRILGAAVIGVGGGEVMAMLQIAMMARMPYTSLRDGVFAHPTLAESLNNLFTSMET